MSWSLAAARELPDMELGGTRQRDRDAESSLSGRRRGMREQYLRQSSMLPLPRSQHPAVSSVAAPVSVNGILSRPPRAPTAFSSQRRQDLYDPWGAFDSLEDMDVPPRGDPIGLRSRSSLFRNRTSAPNTTPTAGTPSRRPPGPPPPPPRPSGSQPILESGPSRVEWSTFGVSLIWDDLAQRKTDMEEEHIKQTGTSDSLATTQSHDQQARPATSLSAHSKDPFDCLSVGFGGNRWHVALIHPTTLSPDSEAPVPTNPDHLVLYLSCGLLELDYPHNDVTVPAVVHLALFEPEHQRGAKSEPIWSIWEEFTFASPDEEYFQCLFPTITELFAQSSAIRAKNSAILHVQIQSPRRAPALSAQASGLTTAPRFMDSVRLPHESLAGLGALLDEPNTGDVRIYVHERMPDHLLPDKRQPLYRKRVLLGHSAILRARSSFFKSMLDNDSEWTEAAVEIEESTGRRRRVHHVALNVEFATMFHLLRWLYKDCSKRFFFCVT